MVKNEGSDNLFKLVHALDANEKGYVKKVLKRHSAKGNVSLQILTALEKQQEHDEKALKKTFKNYAVVKVQTWDAIMDALCIYNKNQSLTSEINNAFNQIVILHTKGLVGEVKKLVDKCIQKCYDNDEYHALIKLLAVKSNLMREYKNPKEDLATFNDYSAQIQSSIEKLKEIYLYTDESMRFYYLQADYEKDKNIKPIDEFKNHSFLFNRQPATGQALKTQDTLYSLYYSMKQDYKLAAWHSKRALEYSDNKIKRTGYFDPGFIPSSTNLVRLYLMLDQFPEAQSVLNNLKHQVIKNKTFGKIRDADILLCQLHIYNQSLQLLELQAYLKANEKAIQDAAWDYPKETGRIHLQLHYLISLLLLKKHKEAVRWILQCCSNKYFRNDSIMYGLVMLIEIALHYILDDTPIAIKKAKYLLDDEKMDVPLKEFNPLFKALAIADRTKRNKALAIAIDAVKKASKNKNEAIHILLNYFDVFDWMHKALL